MKFEISKSMENKINNWDKCEPKDVTGAKFAYIFIPTKSRIGYQGPV